MTPSIAALAAALAATAITFSAPALVKAQTAPNPQAEALNEEGKALFKTQDFTGAAEKFRAAIVVAPSSRYYFNLCATLDKAGDYDAALEACDSVYAYSPTEDLKGKTGQRAAEIRQKKRARDAANPPPNDGGGGGATGGGTTGDGGGGGTPGGDGATGGASTVGGGAGYSDGGAGYATNPPADDPEIEKQADVRGKYKWALGADIGAVFNRGVGDSDRFGNVNGQAVRLHGDLMFFPRLRLGLQAFVNIAAFNEKDLAPDGAALSIIDVGAGLYHHVKIAKGLFVTPLVGLEVANIFPDRGEQSDAFVAAGFRVDVGVQYVFGNGHHVVSVTPLSVNFYSGSAADTAGADPSFYGFDSPGTVFAFTVGYSYRFTKDILPNILILE